MRRLKQQIADAQAIAQEAINRKESKESIKYKWKQYGKLRSTWLKRILQRKKVVFQKSIDILNYPSKANEFSKLISRIKRNSNKEEDGLNTEHIDDYCKYFESTFGSNANGSALQYNIDTLSSTSHTASIIINRIHNDITDKDIKSQVSRMANGKAPGVDCISVEMFKCGGKAVFEVLAKLFNICKTLSCIPSQWKEAIVKPIYKKNGNKTDISNYRPISLTCTCRRIFESLYKYSLSAKINSKLSPTQGGFRDNKNTYDQLFLLHELSRRNSKLVLAFLDIKAAYDCVDRRILWTILSKQFNLEIDEVRLLRSMFDNNVSLLNIQGNLSRPINNYRGLFQGSSLSPLLFNAFINSLITLLNKRRSKVRITANVEINNLFFADDGVLCATTYTEINKILKICEKWSTSNGIEFKPSKCAVISKGGTSQPTKIYNTPIPEVKEYKYLGMIFKKDGIDFKSSIIQRNRQVSQVLEWMRSIGLNINGWRLQQSIRTYKLFIRSMCEYGLGLSILTKTSLKPIEKLQNKALRYITGATRNTSIAALHTILSVEPIHVRNQTLNARYISKVISSKHDHLVGIMFRDIIRENTSAVDKKSLIYRSIKLSNWGNSFTSLGLGHENELPDEDSLQEYRLNEMQEYQNKGGVTANALPPIQNIYGSKFIKESHQLARHDIRVLVMWKLGNFANHQQCQQCGGLLSNQHIIDCGGISSRVSKLLKKYKFKKNMRTRHGNLNMVCELMYQMETKHYNRINWKCYQDLAKILQEVRTKLLGHKSIIQNVNSDDESKTDPLNIRLLRAHNEYMKTKQSQKRKK